VAIGRGTLALAFLGLVVLIGLGMVLLAGMRAGGERSASASAPTPPCRSRQRPADELLAAGSSPACAAV